MDTVQPRNNPGDEMVTQGQEVKPHVYLPNAQNAEGNESGETALIPGSGTRAPFAAPSYINIDASGENLSAKFKNGAQDIPDAGRNQYQ